MHYPAFLRVCVRDGAVLLLLTETAAMYCSGQANVVTYHNDNFRTGQNLTETILTPANVKASTFGRLFTVPMDGKVDAQPLHVSNLRMPNGGAYNVVFAETEHGSAYAFDADSGRLFWHARLLKPGERTSDSRNCGQVTPEIGITATPVIDLSAGPHGTIYMLAMSRDSSGNYEHRLHALDLTTGAEEFGGPVTIAASYPGSGANSSNGRVVFDAKQYKSRAALLLLNGVVYTSWGSHCDIGPYTGWMMGYDRLSLRQTTVFNFAPNGSDAALWNSGAGPAADLQGNIFVAVANGTFDNRGDYGNAFVKLSLQNGRLNATDYWTMYDSNSESNNDIDLGSGGIMLLPDVRDGKGAIRKLATGAGKDSNLYVVDRNNMGKYDPAGDATIYQQLSGALPGGVFSSPAYFDGHVYYGPEGSAIEAFEVVNAKLAAFSATSHVFTYPGATPSISAAGNANPILWAVENSNPAVLHAYDPMDLSTEYYNSNQAGPGRDRFGPGNKYITPTIANGEVFVGTTNSVAVFGILPASKVSNGEHTITSQFSTLVLTGAGSSGSVITEAVLSGAGNQKWIFSFNGGAFYTIRNASSNLYMADPGGSKTRGTQLEQQAGNGSDAQLWSLQRSGSGYVIRNKASGLVVDDSGFSVRPGTGMQVWTASGNSNQAWIVE